MPAKNDFEKGFTPPREGLSKEELILNKKKLLVLKIEKTLRELFKSEFEHEPIVSAYLAQKLDYNYTYLSNLYSEITGVTLKTFIISIKIELIKELLVRDEHTITEIADMLHYKTVSHMSTQFKSVTGITPTYYLASRLSEGEV